MRSRRSNLCSASVVLLILIHLIAAAKDGGDTDKPKHRAEPRKDYLVKAYPAQFPIALSAEDLDKLHPLRQTISCDDKPFDQLKPVFDISSHDGEKRVAYVIHLAEWKIVGGAFVLDSSRWYTYRAVLHHESKTGGKCELKQLGFKANGQPRLYGEKTVWLIGMSYFSQSTDQTAKEQPVDLSHMALTYKISSTPGIAENVQDLGALLAAVLGATPSAVGPFVGFDYTQVQPEKSNALVAIARIHDFRHLPSDINFNISFTPTVTGGLPQGWVGIPYTGSISASGGNNNFSYALVEGNLPPGLGLDPLTGAITGTPVSPANNEFTIEVRDSSKPEPNKSIIRTRILVVKTVPISVSSISRFQIKHGVVGERYDSSELKDTSVQQFETDSNSNPPEGLTLNPADGTISGTPIKVGIFSFTIKKTMADKSTLTVPVQMEIDPKVIGGLPPGKVGVPYSSAIVPMDKTTSYSYFPVEQMPKGLSLNPSSGAITGTPRTAGNFMIKVQLKDNTVQQQSSGGPKGNENATGLLTIEAKLHINPSSTLELKEGFSIALPEARSGDDYSVFITAPDGTLPKFTVTGLPSGFQYDSASGKIFNIPADIPPDVFILTFIDASGNVYRARLPVLPASTHSKSTTELSDTSVISLPEAKTHEEYRAHATTSSKHLLESVSGLPPGLQFNSAINEIFGSPLSGGTFDLEFLDVNKQRYRARMIVVPTIQLEETQTTELPEAKLNEQYIAMLQGENGSRASKVVHGKLPPGLTLDNGRMHGKLLASGTFRFKVEASGKEYAVRMTVGDQSLLLPLTITLSGAPGGNNQPGGGGKNSGAGNSPGGQQSNNGGGGGPGGPSGNKSAVVSQNNGGGNNQGSGSQTVQTVDCSVVSQSSPCMFTHTLRNDDREAFDFSVGITVPGVREAILSSVTATPSIKRHTDLYGLADIYPLAFWKSKESWVPHFNLGIPVTSQPFHRPYFGVAENLTSWTNAEKVGFPLRINFFGGIAYMKQSIVKAVPGSSTTVLGSDRVIKPMWGIEVPVSSIVSKIGGGGSKSQGGGKQSGGGGN
jgi:hypothetical protein